MKLLIKIMFLNVLFFSVTSCEQESSLRPKKISEPVTLSGMLERSTEDARAVYEVMTPQERLNQWSEWLEESLAESQYTARQKEFILEAKSKLRLEIFERIENPIMADFKYIWVPDFVQRASSEFPRDDFGNIFYRKKKQPLVLEGPPGAGEGQKSCDCNQGSLFSCNVGCEDGSCKSKTDGCGFFWAWECNGLCVVTNP